MSPCATLKKLIDGNKRFAQGKSIHPNLGSELRNSLVDKQKPFAAVLSCSDSRVPIEIIFDMGLGDLFVVRTAGHVLSNEVLGSLEYAVGGLGVKLIMILGHDNCGAIQSALSAYNSNQHKHLPENLQSVLNHIYPVFENLDKNDDSKLLQDATVANIHYQVKNLKQSDDYLARKIQKGDLLLVGAKYNLSTGLIEVFE